jgi:hypothetical protein
VSATRLDVPVPGCPAGPTTAVAFCRSRWGIEVAIPRWTATLERRERVVRRLRSAGDTRAADAAGWLSLSGVLAGLPARMVARVLGYSDPAGLVDHVATMVSAGYGPLRCRPDPPPGRHITDQGLEVVDAGSRSGWAIVDMTGRAACGDVVAVDGHPLTPNAFLALLRGRIDAALQDPEA